MSFDATARRRAQALLEALTDHITKAATAEHDALRAAVDARMVALREALAHPDQARLLERLVQDLSSAAQEQAEAIAVRVSLDAEQAAEVRLDGLRSDLHAQLAALQAANAGLVGAAEEARQQVRMAEVAAQAEVERTRQELEEQLDQAQRAHAELAGTLADTQQDASLARAQADAQAASLRDEQARVKALEQDRARILLSHDEAAKDLEAEKRRAGELAESLETARQEATLAKAEADGRGRDLEAATAHIRTVEEIRTKLETEMQERAREERVARVEEEGVQRDRDVMLLDRLGTALQSVNQATIATEILETVLGEIGQHFARAAVFLVGPSSLKGWRGLGLGPTTDISDVAIPHAIDSLLRRTLADGKPVAVAQDDGDRDGDMPVGLSGSAVVSAVAFPVLANGRAIAVVYAEDAQEFPMTSPGVGRKIAEILVDHASRRLTAKRRPAPHSPAPTGQQAYLPARQARRVKVQDGTQVTLDGASSFLVDLSVIGAQVLSPLAMRPNRLVSMTLSTDEGALACEGRVVWALFEQPRGTAAARYRVGVKFTEIAPKAVEAFLRRHGIEAPEGSLEPAKLEETA